MTAGPSAALASTDVQLVATAGATVATAPVSIVVSNRNGLLDRTFASTGYVTTTFGVTDAALFDVSIQPDGDMLVAGSIGVTPARNVVIARFHPDGMLDSTFGSAGVVTWDLGADGLLDQRRHERDLTSRKVLTTRKR